MNTESIFYVQLVKSDVISFKMIGKDDLKLKYLPTPLLNYISQGHMPFDLIKSVHRTIRNFEGSEWEEMINERGNIIKRLKIKYWLPWKSGRKKVVISIMQAFKWEIVLTTREIQWRKKYQPIQYIMQKAKNKIMFIV